MMGPQRTNICHSFAFVVEKAVACVDGVLFVATTSIATVIAHRVSKYIVANRPSMPRDHHNYNAHGHGGARGKGFHVTVIKTPT